MSERKFDQGTPNARPKPARGYMNLAKPIFTPILLHRKHGAKLPEITDPSIRKGIKNWVQK